jgi:hypothetical protein
MSAGHPRALPSWLDRRRVLGLLFVVGMCLTVIANLRVFRDTQRRMKDDRRLGIHAATDLATLATDSPDKRVGERFAPYYHLGLELRGHTLVVPHELRGYGLRIASLGRLEVEIVRERFVLDPAATGALERQAAGPRPLGDGEVEVYVVPGADGDDYLLSAAAQSGALVLSPAAAFERAGGLRVDDSEEP